MTDDAQPGPGGRGRAIRQVAAGLLLFVLADHLAFRADAYGRWVAPVSSAGNMARAIDAVEAIPKGQLAVLVLGSSKIGEGFSTLLANQAARDAGVTFASAAIPGSSPRVWFYLLRRMLRQPDARLRAVAIMLETFHDNDYGLESALTDLAFVHPYVGPADVYELAASYPSWAGRRDAAAAVLLKGPSYHADLLDFAADPARRLRDAVAWRAHGQEWTVGYDGRDQSLAGLMMDPDTGALSGPSVPESIRPYAAALHQNGARPPDNPGAVAYRGQWLGGIADLCAASGIELIVFRIPRGPLHGRATPDPGPEPTGVVRDLALAHRLETIPATTFAGLERPEYFFDQLHLNRAGRQIFSRALARAVLPHLPP